MSTELTEFSPQQANLINLEDPIACWGCPDKDKCKESLEKSLEKSKEGAKK